MINRGKWMKKEKEKKKILSNVFIQGVYKEAFDLFWRLNVILVKAQHFSKHATQ